MELFIIGFVLALLVGLGIEYVKPGVGSKIAAGFWAAWHTQKRGENEK